MKKHIIFQFIIFMLVAICWHRPPNAMAAKATDLLLDFRIKNLQELEMMQSPGAIEIVDANSKIPAGARLQITLFRIFPAIGSIIEPVENGLREVEIGSANFMADVLPFQYRYIVGEVQGNAFPPGLYRAEITFGRGQKRKLRKLIKSLDIQPKAEQSFFVGSKKQIFKALGQDILLLESLPSELSRRAQFYREMFRLHMDGEGTLLEQISGWVDAIGDKQIEMSGRVNELGTKMRLGIMADAYGEATRWFSFYQNQRLGQVRFNIGTTIENDGTSVNVESFMPIMDSGMEEFFIDANLCRQIPYNCMFFLQDATQSINHRYIEFSKSNYANPAVRARFELDWTDMFTEVKKVWRQYETIYDDKRIDSLIRKAREVSRNMPRDGESEVPGSVARSASPASRVVDTDGENSRPKPFKDIVIMLLNINDFLMAFRAEEDNFRNDMQDYIAGIETLQLEYAALADKNCDAETLSEKMTPAHENLVELQENILNHLQLRLEYPIKAINELDEKGLIDDDEEEEGEGEE